MLEVCMIIMCNVGLEVGRISLCEVFGFLVILMLVVFSNGSVFLKMCFLDSVSVSWLEVDWNVFMVGGFFILCLNVVDFGVDSG